MASCPSDIPPSPSLSLPMRNLCLVLCRHLRRRLRLLIRLLPRRLCVGLSRRLPRRSLRLRRHITCLCVHPHCEPALLQAPSASLPRILTTLKHLPHAFSGPSGNRRRLLFMNRRRRSPLLQLLPVPSPQAMSPICPWERCFHVRCMICSPATIMRHVTCFIK